MASENLEQGECGCGREVRRWHGEGGQPNTQDPLGAARFGCVLRAKMERPDPPSFGRKAFGYRKLCLFSAEGSFLTYVHPSFLKEREV